MRFVSAPSGALSGVDCTRGVLGQAALSNLTVAAEADKGYISIAISPALGAVLCYKSPPRYYNPTEFVTLPAEATMLYI